MPRHLCLIVTVGLLIVTVGPPLTLPRAARAETGATIIAIRWETEGAVGKVVIETSGPFTFRTLSSKTSIVVDLWRAHHVRWQSLPVDHPFVSRIRINQITRDVARVRLSLARPARYKTFLRADGRGLAVLVIPPWMATRRLPASVAYEKLRVPTGAGSTAVHVLRVDPQDPALEIRPALAADMVSGRQTTSIIATRFDAVAGVNGGYFSGWGLPLGMVVIDGQLVSAPLPRRSVFAISRAGRPLIGAFAFQGRILTPDGVALWISAINRPPRAGGLALYTPHYGPLTPPHRLAAVVRQGVVDQLTRGRILVPADGYVLAVSDGDARLLREHLRPQMRLQLRLTVDPDLDVISALGGGPRLVQNGREHIPFAWEWFASSLFSLRAPRTAVGITAAGKLLFVTVDGRSARNTGMTLRELAALMIRLGATDAMNLDGGGSATMVVGGRIVNDPSGGEERPVGSALLVLQRSR